MVVEIVIIFAELHNNISYNKITALSIRLSIIACKIYILITQCEIDLEVNRYHLGISIICIIWLFKSIVSIYIRL